MPKAKHLAGSPLTLIVEPNPKGHRLYYVGLLVESCRSQGRSVLILTTATALKSAEWSTHLAAKAPQVIIQASHAFALSNIAEAATTAGATLTILSDGDRYLLPIVRRGWPGAGELSVLVLRADGQPRATPWLRHMRGAAKKTLAWSASLRPRIRVSALRSPLVRRRGPLRWAPDPVTLSCTADDMNTMRRRLECYGDRYWIGVFGVITARKHLPLIIESILDQPDIGLVIGGSIDAQVAQEIGRLLVKFAAGGGHVLHLNGTLTDAEFDSAISAVDCVVVAHSNEGPSGVVLKAAASGRRLVLAGAKSLKRDAECLGDQAIWCSLNAAALDRAIRQVRRSPEAKSKVNLDIEGFVAALA